MRKLRSSRLKVTLFLFTLAIPSQVMAVNPLAPEIVIGDSVRHALDRFSFNIVSSEGILPAKLKVTLISNGASTEFEQANQILAPHGLRLVMLDSENGYVSKLDSSSTTQAPATNLSNNNSAAIETPSMEEVIVSAPYRLSNLNSQKTSLSSHQLNLLPSVGRDTLRGISIVPGVSADGVSAKHRFRGSNDNEITYLLDGVELIEAFHFSDIQNLFTAVNPNIIDLADVYVAGFPVELGNKMGGVVDLQLVEAETPIQATIDVNTLAAAADVRAYKGNFNWLISGRKSIIDQFSEFSKFNAEFETPKFDDNLARVQWQTGNHEITLGTFNSSENISVKLENASEKGNLDYRYKTNWLRWRHKISNTLASRFQFNQVDGERHRTGTLTDPDDATGTISEHRHFKITSVTNQWDWQVRDQTLIKAGGHYSYQKGDFESSLSSQYSLASQAIQNQASLTRDLRFVQSGSTSSAYVAIKEIWNEKLSSTLGFRFEQQNVSEKRSKDFNFRFTLNYNISENMQANLNTGRYNQQQSLHEIQIDEGKAQLDQPQDTDQLNLDFRWTPINDLTLRVDAYFHRINKPWTRYENLYNRWVLFPELHGDRYLIQAQKARNAGFEFSVSNNSQPFTWHLSYALNSSEERVDGVWHKRPWDQKHSYKIGLAWQSKKWRFGAVANYRSGWPTTNLIGQGTQLPANLYQAKLPNYFSLDLHATRSFQTKLGRFESYLDISNATNKVNVGGARYTAGGTKKNQNLLGILPSVGLSWHWQ